MADARFSTPPGVPAVRAVERAVEILRAFSRERQTMTLSEIARAVDLDKSTTRRILSTLCSSQFILFDKTTHLYSLGLGVLTLNPGLNYRDNLRDVATPVLTKLAAITGATAFLWVPFQDRALCLDRVRGVDISLNSAWAEVGSLEELNAAGGPRTIWAHLDEAARSRLLDRGFSARTPLTEIDSAALMASASKIRARGWEFAQDDHTMGVSGLGAPLHDAAGDFAGALSIATITPRMRGADGGPLHLIAILEAAAEIGARLKSPG